MFLSKEQSEEEIEERDEAFYVVLMVVQLTSVSLVGGWLSHATK
tara:strand:+ start:212 stop:343 length:132 start_codon:yes stop_codon:yes gene_type:complete